MVVIIHMPKVSKEYLENKRKIILDAAYRVFTKKPAYNVSMKDIVKESKLSQGGVYKYFANIDEIISAILNVRKLDIDPADILKEYNHKPEKAIFELLESLKEFFFAPTEKIGKILFELHVVFLNDKKRMNIFSNSVNEPITLNYWIKELFLFIDRKIEENYFNPIIDIKDIYMQIIVTLRGIGTELIITKNYNMKPKIYYYKSNEISSLDVRLDNLLDGLYKTILFLLGYDNNKINSILKDVRDS